MKNASRPTAPRRFAVECLEPRVLLHAASPLATELAILAADDPAFAVQASQLSVGPYIGGVDAHSGKVFVRTATAGSVTVEYSTSAAFTQSSFTAARQTAAAGDFTAITPITGLVAETRYYYRVYVNGQLQPQAVHSFETFPAAGAARNFSFAVTADTINAGANPGVGAPVYAALAADDPLFMLQIGDFDHRNPGSLAAMRTMHRQVLGPSTATGADFDEHIAPNMPVFHVWDDHDYGANNGDKTFAGRASALKAFREYYATPTLPNPAGIWHSFGAGQIDVMMLDVRSQRDPAATPDGPGKSMLDGDNIANGQKAWLKAALLNSSATWKFIVSGVTFNPTTKPADAWGAYATERNELVNFIRGNNISGVIFVSGDLHSGGAIDGGANAGFPEISVPHTNLNTNQKASGPVGAWSEGLITGINNPGYVLITVNGDQVTLQVKGVTGAVKKSLTLGGAAANPEIAVFGNGLSIADGDPTPAAGDHTNFGAAAVGAGSITRTFTIKNVGAAALQLTGAPRVHVAGAAAADFVVTAQPMASVPAGGSTTFQVAFTPTAGGLRTAVLTIANNDGDENPFNFTISGSGVTATSQWIVDDGDPGFSTVGTWGVGKPAGTYQGDQRFSAKGTGADKATWTVGNLAPGDYEVFTRWAGSGTINRASNAPYTVFDGAVARATVLVNQQVVPSSVTVGGVAWHRLGAFAVNSGTLKVTVTDKTNGYVFADALRVVPAPQSFTASLTAASAGAAQAAPRITTPLMPPQIAAAEAESPLRPNAVISSPQKRFFRPGEIDLRPTSALYVTPAGVGVRLPIATKAPQANATFDLLARDDIFKLLGDAAQLGLNAHALALLR